MRDHYLRLVYVLSAYEFELAHSDTMASRSTHLASQTAQMLNGLAAPSALQQQEDISTIFVIGFPEDMQVGDILPNYYIVTNLNFKFGSEGDCGILTQKMERIE